MTEPTSAEAEAHRRAYERVRDRADGMTTAESDALDRMRLVLRGYATADRERQVERRWWMAAVVAAYALGHTLGWALS